MANNIPVTPVIIKDGASDGTPCTPVIIVGDEGENKILRQSDVSNTIARTGTKPISQKAVYGLQYNIEHSKIDAYPDLRVIEYTVTEDDVVDGELPTVIEVGVPFNEFDEIDIQMLIKRNTSNAETLNVYNVNEPTTSDYFITMNLTSQNTITYSTVKNRIYNFISKSIQTASTSLNINAPLGGNWYGRKILKRDIVRDDVFRFSVPSGFEVGTIFRIIYDAKTVKRIS